MSDPSTDLPADPDRPGAGADGPRVVIIGGGPGGYEAALSAARQHARVTLIEERGIGGAAVLTDVVPSKTLIATADVLDLVAGSAALGIRDADAPGPRAGSVSESLTVDLAAVNRRVRALAEAQSDDIRSGLEAAGVRLIAGRGRFAPGDAGAAAPHAAGTQSIEVLAADDACTERVSADVTLIAVGATPRVLPSAEPDGERILTWTQLYALDALPEHLIVVGSGVTGAEFASAYHALGSEVTLVSSRDQVLPGSDADAAELLQRVFERRGITVRSRSRAAAARRDGEGVVVTLEGGEEIRGSHALLALGAIPATDGLGLEDAGLRVKPSGHIETDRVSRTSVRGIYAAGDCTGVYPLASVAAMQGRIAMHHALGEAVSPLISQQVASAVFTSPEIATVGVSEADVVSGDVLGEVHTMPLATNPRAKMQGIREGFVKLIVRPGTHTVIGGVVVAPRASELIHPITLAIAQRLTAEEVAAVFTVYPSLSGTIAETARRRP
ncbi:NAD(P)H-quinone dehydrogenase [Brachybacterium sp. JHP9]|uniref:NAD(P)H-quinone dehydrogenase n=1 Tax=Brachybacterium equifaecis TaxID=2910770 RepID=A0ABT0R5R2_9MICO|nr:NAD(P)H-quinone dehydrogenase [Brachybacterium equifaecis]